MERALRHACTASLLWLGCATSPGLEPHDGAFADLAPSAQPAATGVALTGPVSWKERLPVRYAFVEHRGDYREFGAAMRALLERARELGDAAEGPPFALFLDDPGSVASAELRARACIAIQGPVTLPAGLAEDVLPGGLVVYARARGAYPELPRIYAQLFAYARERGWRTEPTVREIYLVNPASAAAGKLWAEVQVLRAVEPDSAGGSARVASTAG